MFAHPKEYFETLLNTVREAQAKLSTVECAVQECLARPLLDNLNDVSNTLGEVEEYLWEVHNSL
jgi:hypothetical protein